jgi:outer membrane lipoprotein-sorting protein
MKIRIVSTFLAVFLFTGLQARAKDIASAEELIAAMHARYQKSWYDTLTFTQKSTTYNPDGTTKVDTWYEAASLPGKLRIDFGPPSDGNGVILADGNATFFQKGTQTASRPLVNMLLVLGFDVYRQPPDVTLALLKAEGIDLTKFHEDSWQGVPTYVVGADKGDLKSKQFWVEQPRLLFVRIIEPDKHDPNKSGDTRFTDYRQTKKGFVAARVEVYSDNKMTFTEDYSDIQIDAKLDPGVFDPQQFATAHWEK